MRIVQVAPYFFPHSGGVESHVRSISAELVRQGHQVIVVTSQHDRSLPPDEVREGYRVLRVPTRLELFSTPLPLLLGQAVRWVGEGADVVHLHHPPPVSAYLASRALRRLPPRVCLTYHCDLYLPGIGGRLITGLYNRIFLPSTLHHTERVIVHTKSYGVTSIPLRGRALDIVPSAVDLSRFHPGNDSEAVRHQLGLDGQRLLAFAGRLVPHKAVDGILRVLPELPSDVALIVVGRGPQLTDLRALARRLGVEERVRFLTDVTDDQLPVLLRSVDLFVFPSQNRLEGFGLVVAEAMASGLPVVIADMPGVREVIEPGREGLLVEPMIEGDLAAKIQELLDDPARCRAMGRSARQRAEERYALPKVVRQLIRVYSGPPAAG